MTNELNAGTKAVWVNKIGELVARHANTESEVVYMLTLIRKVMEAEETAKKYSWLNFYCDWALHAEMSRKTTKQKLKTFDDWAWRTIESRRLIRDEAGTKIMIFQHFRDEMELFLADHDLPVTIPTATLPWLLFMQGYGCVISAVPWECKDKQYGLRTVYALRVTIHADRFNKATPEPNDNFVHRFVWTLYSETGEEIGSWHVDANWVVDGERKTRVLQALDAEMNHD